MGRCSSSFPIINGFFLAVLRTHSDSVYGAVEGGASVNFVEHGLLFWIGHGVVARGTGRRPGSRRWSQNGSHICNAVGRWWQYGNELLVVQC